MQLRLRPNLQALPQTLFIGCVWLFALGLTAWISASWYWHLSSTLSQSAQATPVSDPIVAAKDIASRQLFGRTAESVASVTAPPVDLTVVGVSTQWGKLAGFALIKNGTEASRAFAEGDEIANGIKLVRVLADGIEIDRNGVSEHIKLNLASSAGITPSTPQAPTSAPSSTPSAPAAENKE